jgi:hypothetical protein
VHIEKTVLAMIARQFAEEVPTLGVVVRIAGRVF